ncbi:isoflavone reductase family protein [Rutstroemia sp. NJR-2017a BVV2]|nr:isoflavone reductase family protein [Rutstroemia sp. NJR-2017a BVV2]
MQSVSLDSELVGLSLHPANFRTLFLEITEHVQGSQSCVEDPEVSRALRTRKVSHIIHLERLKERWEAATDASVVIKEVDYDLPESLKAALTGIDALIIVLNIGSIPDTEYKLIEAAAATGVKWILPTEFGGDSGNEEIRALPISAVKIGVRERIEELGMKWAGLTSGPWLDWSLKAGAFQIDVPNRKVMFINGGTPKFNTTDLETVGLAAARLITLPSGELEKFANRFVYVRSYLTSQKEIFEAVKKVSSTSDADWIITEKDAGTWIREGWETLKSGDFNGMVAVLYGHYMKGGPTSNFEAVREISNDILGLPVEDLEEGIKKALA